MTQAPHGSGADKEGGLEREKGKRKEISKGNEAKGK
jgi:hypothetical protein